MGWLDVFCCWRRADGGVSDTETEVLVAPARARARGTSVTSQDGYGTMTMSVGAPASRVTHAQKERMAEISRAAGSHMRPIGGYTGRSVSPLSDSATSSRTPSPSPPRPESSPPGGMISPAHSATSRRSRASSSRHSFGSRPRVVSAPDEVVHKSIFDGVTPPPSRSQPTSRRSSGSSKKKRRRVSGTKP
ncbi:hypothetical protein CspHIS471_0504890 [Cutaneotrichosporon sp. HIS471]|nr:hypothetical protein CspHIS471_0504890 [Cutaneotrichosporon sp. HIS471]